MDFESSSSGARNPSAANLVKIVAAATFLGILAADALATLAARGSLPRVSLEWPNDMDKLTIGSAAFRGAGIDGTATATIRTEGRRRDARASSPCGEIEP